MLSLLPVPATTSVRGACGHDCPDTCGWVVDVRDGVARTLSGDREHPFTRGTLCAKVNHYLERVYHPDRVLHPLKRVGPKGEARFERVTWDEALADIARRWQAIIAASGAEAILPYSSAGVQGIVQEASLDRRLFGSMGCSQLDRTICGAVASHGLKATIGVGSGIDPEQILHSRYVVLWGTNTVVTNLHYWPLVREAQSRGARIVVVDPVRTRTAAAADWHLPIRPGMDATLALAMMHVMIRDGLVDLDYVTNHAVGYDALVERVRDYAPAAVADRVGLPAADIERFAREYATTQPSLLRPLIGLEHHRNGAMQFRTIACLAVLSGAFRHRGGGLARSTHALHFGVLQHLLAVQDLQHVPADRLALAVGVGGEDQAAGALHGLGDLVHALGGLGVHIPAHREVFVGAHRSVLRRQVADVAIRGQHLVAGAKVPIDGLGLGRTFDDDDVHAVWALEAG